MTTDGAGHWLALWVSGEPHDHDLFVARSTDNGASWTDPTLLNTPQLAAEFDLQVTTDGVGTWLAVWWSSENILGAGTDGNIFMSTFTLDSLPLRAKTITPNMTGPTNASNIEFAVIFSEAVVNFDAETDLIFTHIGMAHTGVAIMGGPQTYTVTVTGISGDGGLNLAVNTNSDVQDITGNPVLFSPTSAPIAIDNTQPTIEISEPSVPTIGAPWYTVPSTGGNGCFGGSKAGKTLGDLKDFFGDLFLLGLLSISFVTWRRLASRA